MIKIICIPILYWIIPDKKAVRYRQIVPFFTICGTMETIDRLCYNVRESNEQCQNVRWQNVCLQTILTDYILIGRMPAAMRYFVSREMRSIFEVGTRNCAIDDIRKRDNTKILDITYGEN